MICELTEMWHTCSFSIFEHVFHVVFWLLYSNLAYTRRRSWVNYRDTRSATNSSLVNLMVENRAVEDEMPDSTMQCEADITLCPKWRAKEIWLTQWWNWLDRNTLKLVVIPYLYIIMMWATSTIASIRVEVIKQMVDALGFACFLLHGNHTQLFKLTQQKMMLCVMWSG